MYIYNIFNTHFINYNLNNKIIGRYKNTTQIQINKALTYIYAFDFQLNSKYKYCRVLYFSMHRQIN